MPQHPHLARLESQCISPMSSPARSHHHLYNNLISTFSKSTLDGIKFGNNDKHSMDIRPLLQTLNGPSLVKTDSYVEGWLHDHKHKFEGKNATAPATPGSPDVPENGICSETETPILDLQNETAKLGDSTLSIIKEKKVFNHEVVITIDDPVEDTPQEEVSIMLTDESGTSVYEYEKPESHQSTVNSMTPLLRDVESDPEVSVGDKIEEHISVV